MTLHEHQYRSSEILAYISSDIGQTLGHTNTSDIHVLYSYARSIAPHMHSSGLYFDPLFDVRFTVLQYALFISHSPSQPANIRNRNMHRMIYCSQTLLFFFTAFTPRPPSRSGLRMVHRTIIIGMRRSESDIP